MSKAHMLCRVCKAKEATVHLTQIAGDEVRKLDLCRACAEKKEVDDPTGFSLADLLLGLGTPEINRPNSARPPN